MTKNIIHGEKAEFIYPFNLGQLMKFALTSNGDSVLQVDGETGEEYRANYILKKSTRLARWLQSKNLGPGDVVSIISENRLEYCLIPCATYLTGITLAPLNPEYTSDELQYTLNLSKPKVIFCSPRTLNKIVSATGTCSFIKYVVVFGENSPLQHRMIISFEHALRARFLDALEFEEFHPPEINREETVATIMCSSGTTGMPKGVMTTHKNIVTFISTWAQVLKDNLERKSQDVLVGIVPFFHSMGYMIMTLALLSGRKLIVINKFHPKTFLEILEKYKVTILAVPPPIIVMLCQSPLVEQYDLSSINEIRCGAAPLAKEFEKKISKKLNVKSVKQSYGMTETTLGVLYMAPDDTKLGSVGKIMPAMSAKVINEEGKALGPNCEGELCFKGPLIMKGYINDPVATANTIDKDGFLHTGDIGYYDKDHFFYVVDRIKELIKYKAYQVPPAELEAVLVSHPLILDAAVVGLPNTQVGELPLGYVVVKPNAKITVQEIQDFVKDKVSPQKQLRGGIRFIDTIPRNPSGKILRRVLKQMALNTNSKL